MDELDIQLDWPLIRRHFGRSFGSSLHISIASLGAENQPLVTPIGSFFLNDDQSGFYFEKFASKLPKYSRIHRDVCVLGVDSNRWFWLKSLFRMQFERPPAIKLYGKLGEIRPATESEINRLKRRMRFTRWFKGHRYLWGSMQNVRVIHFERAEPIRLGKMTS